MSIPSTLYMNDDLAVSQVWFAAGEALKKGYLVCFDRANVSAYTLSTTNISGATIGYGADSWNPNRYRNVVKPAAGNLINFAGVVARDYPACAGGRMIEIVRPRGQSVNLWTDANCTTDTTLLCVKAGSYVAGGPGSGVVIGRAIQTVDRSSTNGLVQALADMPSPLIKPTTSPKLWESCPWDLLVRNPALGITFFDDFTRFGPHSSTASGAVTEQNNGWATFISQGGGIAQVAGGVLGGGLVFQSDGDNEGASIVPYVTPFRISTLAAQACGSLWFEARVKASAIADSKNGFFCGLIESLTPTATAPIAADGTLADQNLFGFHRLEGDGDKLDVVYKANGVAQVTSKADAITLVADTWKNIGFKFDALAKTLTVYDDGEAITLTTPLTDTQLGATAGTDFPNDVCVGAVFALLNATGSSPGSAAVEWIRAAQLRSAA